MFSAFENFIAASAAVLTAGTIAGTGAYLHRRGFVSDDGSLFLARITQQVTMPALLFSKIVYCKQDSSTDYCTSVIDMLDDVWILIVWPVYVVCCGLMIGEAAARLSHTPKSQKPLILTSCAFANSTGLPITLLTVLYQNYPSYINLGRVDPTVYLSIYLLVYPMLQWGIGTWLLSNNQDHEMEENSIMTQTSSQSNMDEEDLTVTNELTPLSTNYRKSSSEVCSMTPADTTFQSFSSLWTKVAKVISVSFQPPVAASLLGILVTSIPPLRGVFVDMVNRDDDAPLEWFFDGIYSVGQAAVPLNMMILGINLSKTLKSSCEKSQLLSTESTIAVILGKMVIMPIIGIFSTFLLRKYAWFIPKGLDDSFYLVLMMVFITPTANNVMVMVELGRGLSKEGIARLIGWQYAAAPVILSGSIATVVYLMGVMNRIGI